MSSPARAGSTLLAANPTAVARNALAKLAVPRGSSRYCQRHDLIARLTNIVRSDSASPSSRACTMALRTPRRSTFIRNRITRPAARAITIPVRMCERMNQRNAIYYTALAAQAPVRPHMLLLSACGDTGKMRGFLT